MFRYVCIKCGFISHTITQWVGAYRCPSCQVLVECREYKEEEKNVQQNEGSKQTVN